MKPRLIVLTGSTGFIGSAVLAELARIRDEPGAGAGALRLRTVGRREPGALGRADEWVPADLSDPRSLRGVCEGADVLVHLASLVDSDERRCFAVNAEGTAALMAQARAAGAGRIVHLSTSAVYGPGPHRGIAVDGVVPAPVSTTSRTRLAGERSALAAGAVVLRPGLVVGPGDRWMVPTMFQLVTSTQALWGGGRALLSMVAVCDLARLIARLALCHGPEGGTVWHASHPDPVRTADLVRALAARGVLPEVDQDLSEAECLQRMAASGCRVSPRQFGLVAQDHWYDSAAVWAAAGCPPGPGPLARLDEAAPWYREFLARGDTARSAGGGRIPPEVFLTHASARPLP
ncbi:NAD-dependent epimerase/dehydratase family protein [Streptomyces sp. H34-S4]|uniref:NAD-dependent epimerase/dehydratase family protein n=1 Tax=Streptomyces sp. H34-S4 TaxID=2996463 RepID=UPI00227138D7|nr:NAD-dependent epimerase/dehydratase family protein [Streptomyces sp. H34-S4]MCY0937363.1 NAD-dependent epimerase/dehydratase family protein [Streptomyces sp. H34-S4]